MLNGTSEEENKIEGCLSDSQGMLATMYVNKGYKDQHKEAGIRSEYDKIVICTKYFAPRGFFRVL